MGGDTKVARSLQQQIFGRGGHLDKSDDTPKLVQVRTQRQHHETADAYTGIVVRLSDRWRVITCKDGIQWILQRRDAARSGQARWKGVRYFLTRNALIRASRTLCKRIDPAALWVLGALPERIGGVE